MSTSALNHDLKFEGSPYVHGRAKSQAFCEIPPETLQMRLLQFRQNPRIPATFSVLHGRPATLNKISEALRETRSDGRSTWAVENARTAKERLKVLSARELEIAGMVASGMTNQEVADALGISRRTVEAHRANIMTKARTRRVAELVTLINLAAISRLERFPFIPVDTRRT